MNTRTAIMAIALAAALILLTALSILIRDTSVIWLQTRALGLISYALLFLSLMIGEWHIITKGKGGPNLIRIHPAVSAGALLIILSHGLSAVIDNYKWGRELSLPEYLGFSFSDKWLASLSFGTLALYMLVMVALASSKKGMRTLGFSRWKIVHYLAYPAFVLAYAHSAALGTDIKNSALHYLLQPLLAGSFILALDLLATRIAGTYITLSDHVEVGLAAMFFILLIACSTAILSDARDAEFRMAELHEQSMLQLEAANTAGIAPELDEVTYGHTD
ncbi:MAG: ferric reductase-like transmembrane domain-containing protein [Candidatus Altiarchaeota archaeon]|nr:ferric reductase-like transmembrane domain-containing protein [Candidatus Altiarchaeota archaeon]